MTPNALALLRHVSWPQWRHQPLRALTAVLAIVLGVALAFSVQLINQSALAEFGAAVRSVNGQPDFELRAQRGGLDESLYERVARHPQVAVASPVIEIDTQAALASGERVPVRLLGIDALSAAPVAPALMPRVADDADRLALLAADAAFLNGAAQQRFGNATALQLRTGDGWAAVKVQGRVAAGGPPLVVMDIAAVQARFGWLGRLTRIDVRVQPGADRAAVLRSLALPEGVRAASPNESAERASNMSRAYRVNLTVLALVALFTGAFLVFSILSLSVAQRQPQFALLGVLGLSARERLRLVMLEALLLGLVGSALGLLLGSGLAALALRLLAGDLGGGYFPGVAPRLQFSMLAAGLYGALGVAAAVIGAWLPARAAQRLAPAQALKGLSAGLGASGGAWFGPAMLAAAVVLALLPPVGGLPLPAYASVACLLLGGIACVPAGVGLLLKAVPPPRQALALLAVERARHERHTATIAVAGVVASLSLSVALTVMVTSFRDSMVEWLDQVLPADLYLRTPTADVAGLPPALVEQARQLPGVRRAATMRSATVQLAPERPPVALLARELDDPAQSLPLVGPLQPLPAGDASPGAIAAYVSEGMARLYALQPGMRTTLPLPDGRRATVFVRGVWRDYAHQHGAVVLHAEDYRRLTGDTRVTDLALWLQPGTDVGALQQTLRTLAGADAGALQFSTAGELRAVSLRIFDRSFAVTYWLQAVAIGIGLFGIAASFSAQVLARRKEFGLLAHLGFTRRQVLAVIAGEGAVWAAAGALVGLVLGLAVSVVLVKVVNPQSFHWTMEMALPGGRLALLCAAVVAAGTLTAWLAARSTASRQMALAVKEDW